MTDEIKEILESSRKIIKSNRENGFDRIIMLGDDIDKIIDYITNLQQENERLKELCDKYEEEHSNAFKLWTMKMEEMPCYEEFMNYKSRCEKAIEYIKSTNCYGMRSGKTLLQKYLYELLDILNGSDEK